MSLKNIFKGQYPRGPLSPEPQTTEDYVKTGLAAMAQGGGLGLMGDFMFGQSNRFGSGMIASSLGPTAGAVDAVANMALDTRDALAAYGGQRGPKWQHIEAEAIRFMQGHTPVGFLTNHFYAQGIMNYLVFHRLQDMVNPG
jgi:hypothetical protein